MSKLREEMETEFLSATGPTDGREWNRAALVLMPWKRRPKSKREEGAGMRKLERRRPVARTKSKATRNHGVSTAKTPSAGTNQGRPCQYHQAAGHSAGSVFPQYFEPGQTGASLQT